MQPRITLKFSETVHLIDDSTCEIPGYVPSIMIRNNDGTTTIKTVESFKNENIYPKPTQIAKNIAENTNNDFGYVLDIDRLKKTNMLDILLFETEIGLTEGEVNLHEILSKDEGGLNWIEMFNKYYSEVFNDEVPLTLSIEELPFTSLKYTKFPNDYFEKRDKDQFYQPPKGKIDSIPDGTFYFSIRPPMKWKDGKYLQHIYYRRKVKNPNGVIESYSIDENEDKFLPARGVLLGKLNENDIKDTNNHPEFNFPLYHFLNACYHVSLRHVGKYRPLNIEISLSE
ncbi:MAG: hypothetical protein KKB03_00665 [Nanoarchaeota archaeon]|nr:hypothetical protein [Nanoarchaeota archaeon]MBU1135075.1 hypothetical protein [Nanoarchaeota archaeon]MBU2519741.1 hypothetical protein [Nanoarchaeota archaeon]